MLLLLSPDETQLSKDGDEQMNYKEAMQKMAADEKELFSLMDYPPFREIDGGEYDSEWTPDSPKWGFPTISERGEQLAEAIRDVHSAVSDAQKQARKEGKTIYEVDPQIVANAFNEVFEEFGEDIDEAKLYKKRFPETPISALMQAYKPKK